MPFTLELILPKDMPKLDMTIGVPGEAAAEKLREMEPEMVSASPTPDDKLCELVAVSNDGAWREEIEIEMRNEDNESYTGTVTMTEAKHGIYRDGLGFRDFKNFDGVRFTFKGVRTVTFKLKQQIDVNKLIEKQFFEFKKHYS